MIRCLILALLSLAAVAGPAPATAGDRLEDKVLAELNRVRADPAGYAAQLREYRRYYTGRIVFAPGMTSRYLTEEGVAPVDEAVGFLNRQQGVGELAPASVLAMAAADHTAEQMHDGAVGHDGEDGAGPGERTRRRGGGRYVGEVITYGSDNAVDVVRQLIVDDGVADRGHRTLVFAPDLRFAGVACGPHPIYRVMCVVDLARTPDGRSRYELASLH